MLVLKQSCIQNQLPIRFGKALYCKKNLKVRNSPLPNAQISNLKYIITHQNCIKFDTKLLFFVQLNGEPIDGSGGKPFPNNELELTPPGENPAPKKRQVLVFLS